MTATSAAWLVLLLPLAGAILIGFLKDVAPAKVAGLVGTLAIGAAGATNAALLAVAVLANEDETLRERLRQFRREQERQVRAATLET